MKLDRINLEEFICFENKVNFSFSNLNFVVGENGAGKTTLINSIEWLITGSTRMTKGSNIAEKYLITDSPNADKAIVQGYFNDEDTFVERNVTENRTSKIKVKHQGEKVPSGPKAPTKTEKQEEIYQLLNTNQDLAHYLLDGMDFAALSPDDRRKELFSLFDIDDPERAEEKLEDCDLQDEQINELTSQINDSSIDEVIDNWIEKRRSVKRDKRKYKNRLNDIDNDFPDKVEVNDEEFAFKFAINNIDNFEEKIKNKRKKLQTLKGKSDVVQESKEEIEEEINSFEEVLEDKPSYKQVSEKKEEISGEIKSLQIRIKSAEDGKARCIYDQSHECPVDQTKVSNFVEESKEQIKKLEEKYERLDENGEKIRKIENKIEKLNNKKNNALPESDLNKINELEEEISNLDNDIDKVKQLKQDKDEYEKGENKIDKYEDQVKTINDVIDALEDTKERILNDYLDEYRNELSTISQIMNCDFTLSDDMDLLRNSRPYYALSESEQLELTYANQLALSCVTNSNYFALDRVDTLFGAKRVNLIKTLKYYMNQGKIDFGLVVLSSNADKAPLNKSKLIKM